MSSIKIFKRTFNKFVHYHRIFFKNRQYIFVHNGPFERSEKSIFNFEHYEKFCLIPDDVKNLIILKEGFEALSMTEKEMSQFSTLWVAFYHGIPAGHQSVRRGKYFKKWFVGLNENDIVFFRTITYREFRGQGVCPAIMQQAMHILLRDGDRAFVDCKIYNKPAIRAFLKNNFRLLAKMKPITREQALG